MLAGDARADPTVVDLIELAGLWLAADDRVALRRTLQQLIDVLAQRFPTQEDFRARFVNLLAQAEREQVSGEVLRSGYRRATLG